MEVDKKLKKLKLGSNTIDMTNETSLIDRCVEEIKNLRQEYEEERDRMSVSIKQLNEAVLKKADRADVADHDMKVNSKIQDNNKLLINQLASKEETTKRFSQLSKKVRDLIDMYARTQQGEDEGMFTKKNLGPINCASCEKNLYNL